MAGEKIFGKEIGANENQDESKGRRSTLGQLMERAVNGSNQIFRKETTQMRTKSKVKAGSAAWGS
jgi:hypothetical protein